MTDTRFIAFLIWGLGTLVVYTVVLIQRQRAYRRHRDARSRRDVRTAIGLFLTSLGAAGSITVVLFGAPGTPIRTFFIALALGAFSGVGIIMATERRGDA